MKSETPHMKGAALSSVKKAIAPRRDAAQSPPAPKQAPPVPSTTPEEMSTMKNALLDEPDQLGWVIHSAQNVCTVKSHKHYKKDNLFEGHTCI